MAGARSIGVALKALVTGATGLVGSHIVRALLARGYFVRGLIRNTSDCSAIAGLPLETVCGDVLNPRSLKDSVRGCDFVFHAAAHFAYWGKSLPELDSTAVRGTLNVLRAAAAARVSRIVITSSSVVLGYSNGPVPLDEHSQLVDEPDTPYVIAKVRQDQIAFKTAADLGLDLVLVCPTLVVGPLAPTLGPSNAVITSYLEDPIRMTFPGGCNIVAASDVGFAHVLAAIVGRPGERYIAGGENLEWREIHSNISDLCGTYGPTLTASHSACYLAAFAEEMRARFLNRPPLTTRTQATMVGRFYWYEHRKLAKLGFEAVRARIALATALSWLVGTSHVSRETRSRLRLSEEVWTARRSLRDSETNLRAMK